ncbi:MAG: pilus (MSHA type) biogenesis protein MshL [Gammaproteobacteria bacterium]
MKHKIKIAKACCLVFALANAASCTSMRPAAPEMSAKSHLSEMTVEVDPQIPTVVDQAPYIPPPQPIADSERYTVVVNNVPVRELLFALARDAEVNVDIDNGIDGSVTLNAIDQTLPQILDRVARQVAIRYEIDGDNVFVSPDKPYLRNYQVGYVNLSRDVDTEVNVATKVATTGEGTRNNQGGGGGSSSGGSNTSETRLTTKSYNRFWETLYDNISAILGDTEANTDNLSDKVIVNAEAGIVSVRATDAEHGLVQEFIDLVLTNARRQVLIEATIVEVTLNDQYQAGVDWRVLLNDDKSGVGVNQSLLGAVTDGVIDSNISSMVFGLTDPNNNGRFIDLTIRLLREFGDAQVLSSPRLMALNNQTAVLKVVEELVYFEVEVTDRESTATSQGTTFIDTEVRSVPVGLVMALTPQISPNQEVTLTIRPTISEQVGEALDPNPVFTDVTNAVPVIRVREMESVLRLTNGQVAVLGGLMQEEFRAGNREVPGLSRLPIIGETLFNAEEQRSEKTELVIFLRPVIVNDPSIETDLKGYERFLSSNQNKPSS